jgi:hypothetical protein
MSNDESPSIANSPPSSHAAHVVGGVVGGGDLGGARATRGVVKCAGNA